MSMRSGCPGWPCTVLALLTVLLPSWREARADDPRIFNHMTSFGYMNKEEIASSAEAQFVATHYDIWRGLANYTNYLLFLNPDIILSWGLNTRAIAIADELRDWAIMHPEYDPEAYYLHYRYDTEIDTDYGTFVVKGYDPTCWPDCPNSSADSWEESRVPDITNEGWMVPNSRSPGLAHFYATAIHSRELTYGDLRSVFWDWSAGFCVHLDNHLENTWEYEGQYSESWFVHPAIPYFIGIIDSVAVKYRELYPGDSLMVVANGVAPFWMYNHQDGNDYRDALLRSEALELIWLEMGLVVGEHSQPNQYIINTEVHGKYMKDAPVLMEAKKLGIQLRLREMEPTERDKIFALAYAYLFNDPVRMVISYIVEGQEGNPNYDVESTHWGGPFMAYDVGLPVMNPPGVRDINGNENTSVFYKWCMGNDPGNPQEHYTIFARHFEKGMVLVKIREKPASVWDESTATTHSVGQMFRPLRVDGTLGTAIHEVTLRNNEAVILINANTPPFLEIPPNQTIAEGETLRFDVEAHDINEIDELHLSASNLPRGASFVDNMDDTGTFSWTPDYDQSGVYPGVHFEVTDGHAVTGRDMTITVEDANPSGACCLETGECYILASSACAALGGAWDPETLSCDPNPCDVPTHENVIAGGLMHAEEWQSWVSDQCGADVAIQAFVPDEVGPVEHVEFLYSLDGGSTWEIVADDQDGAEPPLNTIDTQVVMAGCGWSTKLRLPEGTPAGPIQVKSVIHPAAGDPLSTITEIDYDPAPPSLGTTSIVDRVVVDRDVLGADIYPNGADIDRIIIRRHAMDPVFVKGVPGINQLDFDSLYCAPAASAQCLQYFEQSGDSVVTAGLDTPRLVRALAAYMGTNQGVAGTLPSRWLGGMGEWLEANGHGHSVHLCQHYDCASGEITWTLEDWQRMRNELELCRDVLVGVFWDGGGGHTLTLDAITYPENPDGTISVGFKDPWTGNAETGKLDPATGHLSDLTGAGAGRGGQIGLTMVVSPTTTEIDQGIAGDLIFDGPPPTAPPYHFDIYTPPGFYLIHITLVNAAGHAHRISRMVEVPPVVQVDDGMEGVPIAFELGACVPNPAYQNVRVAYAVPREAHVSVKVYGVSGNLVRSLVDGAVPAGTHHVDWSGTDVDGRPVPRGAYFVRMVAPGYDQGRVIMLLRR